MYYLQQASYLGNLQGGIDLSDMIDIGFMHYLKNWEPEDFIDLKSSEASQTGSLPHKKVVRVTHV